MMSKIKFRAVLATIVAFSGVSVFAQSQDGAQWKSPKIPSAETREITLAEDSQVLPPIRLVNYSPQDFDHLSPDIEIPGGPALAPPRSNGITVPDFGPNNSGFQEEPAFPPGPGNVGPIPQDTPGAMGVVQPSTLPGTPGIPTRPLREVGNPTREMDECSLIKHKPISEINYDITSKTIGALPPTCPIPRDEAESKPQRNFPFQTVHWKASALYAKGDVTYFEDIQLERYGHSISPTLQPLISGTKFFLTVPVLPYRMGLVTPSECVYDLGYHRPGDCAPFMLEPVPFSARGVLFQAGGIVGGAAALP